MSTPDWNDEVWSAAVRYVGTSRNTDEERRLVARVIRAERALAADRVKQLEEALSRSMTALNDWQNSYASDMCDPHSVEETDARLSEYGVLAYIANVQQQNRLALLNGGSNAAE